VLGSATSVAQTRSEAEARRRSCLVLVTFIWSLHALTMEVLPQREPQVVFWSTTIGASPDARPPFRIRGGKLWL
jgi:hypothetical protein